MSDKREELIDKEEWGCSVCGYEGNPVNIKRCQDETECECPHCESSYFNGEVMSRAEGEICAFCDEFAEEIVEINLGGSSVDKVCRECEEEHWK